MKELYLVNGFLLVRVQTLPYFRIHLTSPLSTSQLLPQAHTSLGHSFLAIVCCLHETHPQRLLSLDLLSPQQHIAPSRSRSDLFPKQSSTIIRQGEPDIHLAHVQHALITPHDDVIMAQSQNEPRGGCVAVDGGHGRHR
ncbi:hypothetical protein CICLE_v10006185mg [Citrus x clementina]|uniref:Uncharacterized protein n=1 Tax=Citrus clementina TaxID=85681 RepID=V4S3K9_CITCL|nr:hypothetical protein CICLE_v10006185mg [Citrus x clementina]